MTLALLLGLACAADSSTLPESARPDPNPTEPTMAAPLELSATLGAEHRRHDGTWRAFTATSRVTATPLAAADRIWIDAQVPAAERVYVITQSREGAWGVLHRGNPGLTPPLEISVVPWRVWVLATAKPVDWLEGADAFDCAEYRTQLAPEVPTEACGFLAGLHRLAPARPRTPKTRLAVAEFDTAEGTTLRGFHAEHSRPDQVAVSFDVDNR